MKVPGFEDTDCLVTAEFFQIHNDVFDILNSRSNRAPGYKRALSENNFAQAQAVFTKVRLMYDIIQSRVAHFLAGKQEIRYQEISYRKMAFYQEISYRKMAFYQEISWFCQCQTSVRIGQT